MFRASDLVRMHCRAECTSVGIQRVTALLSTLD